MIKRFMSYRIINNENNNDFEDFLNSDIGKLYQLNHNINVYLFIIGKYKNDSKSITTGIIKNNLKYIAMLYLIHYQKILKEY